ncbi:MAG: ATP-binding protein, partial [Phycisphaeraceae bacterium]|nr:ATP-binding protein [Phycisphaeraceae bacterium]
SALVRNPMLLEAAAKVLAGAGQQVIDYSIPGPVECHIRAAFAPIHAFAESTATAENATKPAVLLVLHDLTSIKRSEQMRADFVANTSHELRTPLASLVGFIETLQGPARDDEAARDRFLKIMQMQVGRMGRLIDDLLSLSRIEMNEHVPPSTPVDLIGVVRDVLDTLGPRAQEDEVTLRVTLEGAPFRPQPNQAMAWVLGDRDELVQVVQNLVDNAIKYGGRGGTVTIDLGVARPARTTDGDEAVKAVESQTTYYISVQDRGDGIDRQHLPRLTERFYRVDVQQSREQGGTGLGLAIVKHIVNRHRGSLTIESTIAQGSVFSVFLPTARGPVKTEAPGTPPEGS